MLTATAIAHPNIALIKYWGNRDERLRLPANGSISFNLDSLETRTRITWGEAQGSDSLTINGSIVSGAGLKRVADFLDLIRQRLGMNKRASVISENNFPASAGMASSASAFAALALASSRAAGLVLNEMELSQLARRGSGSACRSIPGGFVEWEMGKEDADSHAFTIAEPGYWPLVDCITVVSAEAKPTGSSEGHALASSSPLQAARLVDAPRRLDVCRSAIQNRDFASLAGIVEQDSNLMHAIMQTSTPPLIYWQPATLTVMRQVQIWRKQGLPVCFTIDAGPNVHVITEEIEAGKVMALIGDLAGVQKVLTAGVGGAARLI